MSQDCENVDAFGWAASATQRPTHQRRYAALQNDERCAGIAATQATIEEQIAGAEVDGLLAGKVLDRAIGLFHHGEVGGFQLVIGRWSRRVFGDAEAGYFAFLVVARQFYVVHGQRDRLHDVWRERGDE